MKPIDSIDEYYVAFSKNNENAETGTNPKTESKCLKAFEHAWLIRNLEIDLYWKRATYFWTFIAAALVGFGVIATSKVDFEPRQSEFLVALGCLGVAFSLSWYFVNRGSKFWQENWEGHIDLLEDDITGPLYKTVLVQEETQKKRQIASSSAISVTRVNILVSVFVTIFWIFLVVLSSVSTKPNATVDMWKIGFITITTVYCIFLYPLSKSGLSSPSVLKGTKFRIISRTTGTNSENM